MNRLIAWWASNSVAANLVMLMLIIGGIFGYFRMEKEAFPAAAIDQIYINGVWNGASARDVEEQIVTRLEEAVVGVDGIDYTTSTSREGYGSVNIFVKATADFDALLQEIKTRVDGINNFPPDAFRPTVNRLEFRSNFIFIALHGAAEKRDLRRMAEDIRDELALLPGGELAEEIVMPNEEVSIEISETALRAYDMTFQQVANAIQGSSVNTSMGNIRTSGGSYQLRTNALKDTAEEFGNIVLRQSADGSRVLVKDVATVIDGFEDVNVDGYFNGEPAAILTLLTTDKMNLPKTSKEVRQYIEDKNEVLPANMTLTLWGDDLNIYNDRMSLIGWNALGGMVLVMLVLVLFLRPAVAFWVSVGITTAFAGTIAFLPWVDVSFNMISTFAFLIVIGIVVDDAIVVGEGVHMHRENGYGKTESAIAGAQLVVKPVFFAVVTTIVAFLPWMFISGGWSAYTKQISLVVIIALTISLVESFFILPAHLSHIKDEDPDKMGALGRFQKGLANSLVSFAKNKFRPFVAFLIKFRYATFAVFIGIFMFAQAMVDAKIVPAVQNPEVEGDMIFVSMFFPEGTTEDQMRIVGDQLINGMETLEANSQRDFGVDFQIITGPGFFIVENRLRGFLAVQPAKTRGNISTRSIAVKLEEYVGPIPQAMNVNFGYSMSGDDSGGSARFQRFGFSSGDQDALQAAKADFQAHLETYPEVVRTWDPDISTRKEMQFSLKPGAEALGITLSDVSLQVREAFYGREVQRLPRAGDDVRVMVRYPKEARDSVDSLKNLRIRGQGNVEVPFYEVANVNLVPGTRNINRRDRQVMSSIGSIFKGEGPDAAKAKALVKEDLDENFFPEFYKRHPKVTELRVGADEDNAKMFQEAFIYGVVGLVFIYFLLAMAFRSYFQPILIVVAIPFAWVGTIFGHWITGVPTGNFMAFMGLCAAAGVAVNDNLVLLDYINRLRAQGVGAYQAVVDACTARFRPILLTSVTTFVGIIPILFDQSFQADFLKPLVVALAFGVLFDFFLTLTLVPALYGIGVDISRFFKGLWNKEKPIPLGTTFDPEVSVALEGSGEMQPAE